jgi:transcriptional regulator with XRE-family HTH domain
MIAFSTLRTGIGSTLKILRLEAGMTQDQLADKIGVTAQMVHKYEIGRNGLSLLRLIKTAEVLGTDYVEFIELSMGNNTTKSKLKNNIVKNKLG